MTFENFQALWETLPFNALIFNSFKIALITTIGQLLTCAMVMFVRGSTLPLPRSVVYSPLATLMVPSQITIIPNFVLFRALGLYGTQAPLWLPAFWGGAFGTF
ncbi:MAG: hypothetical protein U0694_28210 [Anaerolineae bacterium]